MATATPTLYPSSLAAWAIEAYQRFISPYKGFRCAHRALHGRDSCSQFAKRVAVKRGLLATVSLLRRRFTECSVAAQVLDYEAREARRRHAAPPPRKNDFCDPTGGADLCDCATAPFELAPTDCGDASSLSSVGDCASGADCGGADCAGCDL